MGGGDPAPSEWAGKSVLIVDQGFVKSRHGKPIHGVELFRLLLIRQLMERGIEVTLAIVPAWEQALGEFFGERGPRLLCVPELGVAGSASVAVVRAAIGGGKRFDTLMIGNIGRGLVPAATLARALGVGKRRFAMAHRRPRKNGGRAVARCPLDILAVSEHVAGPFREAGDPARVRVMYGLPNPDDFRPPGSPSEKLSHADGLCHFVLLGRLPNVSKGEGTAIAAFEALPQDLRERCRLHLVAYIDDPPALPEGVIAHRWTPAREVAALLRSMDVMLALSTNETFSQAIVQGMLSGLPVVATPLPVYVEKLDTGGGVVAEDADAIARAMGELAGDEVKRAEMGAIGRATALERYVWDTDRFVGEVLFASSR